MSSKPESRKLGGLAGVAAGVAITMTFATTVPGLAQTAAVPRGAVTKAPQGASKLILLGTAGGPVIRRHRSQPAILLVVNGRAILIDCGEGTVAQLSQVGYQASDVSRVFLTHLHPDHTQGLASLITFAWLRAKAPIEVYGPPGTKELVGLAIAYNSIPAEVFQAFFTPRIALSDLAAGVSRDIEAPTVIYQDADLKVTAVENTHYGAERPAARSYGIPRSYSYRFEMKDRTIVFTGDTGPSPAVTRLAEGADILVSEVIDVDAAVADARASGASEAQIAQVIAHQSREHLRPQDVGRMAAAAKVKMVVLSHLAYAKDAEGQAEAFISGVREVFDGPVIAGRDFDQF